MAKAKSPFRSLNTLLGVVLTVGGLVLLVINPSWTAGVFASVGAAFLIYGADTRAWDQLTIRRKIGTGFFMLAAVVCLIARAIPQ